MNRARRSTAVYNKKSISKQVSDDDFESDGFSDEPDDDGDFSASEEEWLPGKDKGDKSDAEAQGTVSDDEEESEDVSEDDDELDGESGSEESVVAAGNGGAKKRTFKPSANPWPKKKRLSPATRDELYMRTKKYLLKETDPELPPPSSSVSEILKRCQFQKKKDLSHCSKPESVEGKSKTTKPNKNGEESDSSGDDHLMNPEELDLSSKFFDKIEMTKNRSQETAPQFDCNAGMRLSDSSDDEDQAEETLPLSIQKVAAQQLISKINESSNEFMNFNNLDEFNKKIEEAKNMLKNYQEECSSQQMKSEDVSNLLALGEAEVGTSPGNIKISGQLHDEASEESDWEEVEDAKRSHTQTADKLSENYQITVEVETAKTKKQRWEEIEMELYIKRQINKVKRANQLAFHKSSVLCAIASGKKLNEIINSAAMKGKALSLMQSNQCVLKGKIDGKFIEQLMKWFKSNFLLINDQVLGSKSSRMSFTMALELFTKQAICKRDYVLLFLVCMRAVGVDCRLVISASVPPKRPAMKDLCPISERQLIEKFEKQFKPKLKEETSLQNNEAAAEIDTKEVKVKGEMKEPIQQHENVGESTKTTLKKKTRKSTQPTFKSEDPDEEKAETKKSKAVEHSLPKIEINEPKVECRSTRSRTSTAQKCNLETSTDSSKKLRFSPEPEILSSKQTENSTKENIRPKRSILKRSSPRFGGNSSPSREPLNNLVIPQVDGADDCRVTPQRAPTSRRLRSRVIKTPDSNANASPFAKRKTNTPQIKKKNNNQPGRVSKRKLFDIGQSVKNIPDEPVKPKSSKNKILSSDSSDEEVKHLVKATKKRQLRGGKAELKSTFNATHSSEDSDFEPPGKKKAKHTKTIKSESPKAKVSKKQQVAGNKSSKKPTGGEATNGNAMTAGKMNFWIEFYSDKDKRWTTVDLFAGKINCVDYLVRHATSPISYVFSFDNHGHIKDITPRYVQHWNTVSRMLRVEPKWLETALKPFQAKKTAREKLEDEELNKIHIDKPLPTTIAECKNHPLYVLKRHLLKFEALYPPDAPSLGFVRGEPLYARECLFVLQTREKWYKQGRVVKPFEMAYKVVKCWKYDKLKNEWLNNQPCDIFGIWQTEEFDPPTAENGLVPRNEYGNVELFTPKMLPKKTVHLHLPGLNKVCKRLGIDCAPALTGFEKARMRMIPVYDGFVVCEEFANKVVEEWYKEMEAEDRREQEKYEKRVYGNWKRLIKGLLVRRKLQNKYNFDNL